MGLSIERNAWYRLIFVAFSSRDLKVAATDASGLVAAAFRLRVFGSGVEIQPLPDACFPSVSRACAERMGGAQQLYRERGNGIELRHYRDHGSLAFGKKSQYVRSSK
jgi:hypothetical protein